MNVTCKSQGKEGVMVKERTPVDYNCHLGTCMFNLFLLTVYND